MRPAIFWCSDWAPLLSSARSAGFIFIPGAGAFAANKGDVAARMKIIKYRHNERMHNITNQMVLWQRGFLGYRYENKNIVSSVSRL